MLFVLSCSISSQLFCYLLYVFPSSGLSSVSNIESCCKQTSFLIYTHTYWPCIILRYWTDIEGVVLEQGVEALQAEVPVDGHEDESTADEADAGGQADEFGVGDGAY